MSLTKAALLCALYLSSIYGMTQVQTIQPVNLTSESPHLLHAAISWQILANIQGNPIPLSWEELTRVRRSVPKAVERYTEIINNENLHKAVSDHLVDRITFNELRNSLVILETGYCRRLNHGPRIACAVLEKEVDLPQRPVVYARMSLITMTTLRAREVLVSAHFPRSSDFPMFERDSDFTTEGSLKQSVSGGLQQNHVRRNVTSTILKLQKRQPDHRYPLVFTLDCAPFDENAISDASVRLPEKSVYCPNILWPGSHVTLEIYTGPALEVLKRYGGRRMSTRSVSPIVEDYQTLKGCPSFLHPYRDIPNCCLFRYTLNQEQIRQNPYLNFITFPDYLPLNMCHGRCVDTLGPMDNHHSFLLNEFYRGLSASEKRIIHDYMPCCAANGTTDFTIFYKTDDNKLQKAVWPRAIKTSCACG